MGLFFSFGKCIGVLLVISLSLILTSVGVAISWRILLSTTAVLSLLQALLIFLFCSDTPVEMIEKGLYDRARQIISENYHEEYVEEVFQEYIKDYQEEIGKASIPEGDVRWE